MKKARRKKVNEKGRRPRQHFRRGNTEHNKDKKRSKNIHYEEETLLEEYID
jgi:hypothetical protein